MTSSRHARWVWAPVTLFPFVLMGASTTTSIGISPATPVFGQPVTITATVSPSGSTGSVAFVDRGVLVGSANVVSGVASLTTLTLPAGPHSLVAVYGGGAGNTASQSSSLTYIVTANPGAGFAAPTTASTGSTPNAIAVSDFNGDGRADLAVVNTTDANVRILLGNGSGGFTLKSSPGTGSAPNSVAVGDFNGDGKPDLAVANQNDSNVTVLLGNGDGTFTAAASPSVGSPPSGVAVGDFNGDGKTDLAVSIRAAGIISILLGNGDGTFTAAAASPQALGGPQYIAVGDFNGDGKTDLAVALVDGNAVKVLLGNGDGTFSPTPISPAVGNAPSWIIAADLNGDGKTDLVTANFSSNNISILLGNGNGAFATAASLTVGTAPDAVAAADLNGDGKADLAVVNYSTQSISILFGNGDGTFTVSSPLNTGALPHAIAAGDFNGDGRADLVTTNSNGANISIFLATASAASSVTILNSPNPSTYGQAVTLTANVTPASATGHVEFLDGVSVVGVGALNGSAQAQATATLLPSGTRSLRARYEGQPGVLLTSQSNPAGQTVNPVASFGFGAAATTPATGNGASSMTVGDLNGDGKADLVAGNFSDNNLTVLLGNGDGTFTAAVSPAAGNGPTAVVIGDFNGDGKPDIAVSAYQENSVHILLGNGNGTFTAGATLSVGSSPYGLAIGDFNADGRLDLAVANAGSNTVSILLGNGNGTFVATGSFPTGKSPIAIAVADFNGDGKADLAISDSGDNTVTILLGYGNGTFAAAPSLSTGNTPVSVAAGDLNSDGKIDLVTANNITLSIFLGNGDGTFTAAAPATGGGAASSVAVVDVNGDGKLDLVSANTAALGYLLVYQGKGDGTFLPHGPNIVAGADTQPLVVADFNGDGRVDLAAGNPGGNNITVLLGQPQNFPALSITKTHTGNFLLGQQGATFTITVGNTGTGPTNGVVTVSEGSPVGPSSGLTLTSLSGTGWTCGSITCTRSDVLAPGASYHAITATVNVAANASSGQDNGAIASGVGSTNAYAFDFVNVVNPTNPVLSINKTHTGNFTQGQQGATYTITVFNAVGSLATSGAVTVTDTIPSGLTLVSMSGTGWTCPSGMNTCTRSDALPNGSNYPVITVTVNVNANATSPQVNQVGVSGGGSAPASNDDSTVINPTSSCTFSLSASSAHLGSGSGGFMNTSQTQIFEDPLTGSFTLTATNCNASNAWTAVSNNQPVLSIHNGAFGAGSIPVFSFTGNGSIASTTIGFAMFSNTTGHTRTASVSVAGLTFTITQDASPDTSLQRIVRALYQTLLGREPDSAGFGFWTGPGAPTSNGVVLIQQMADGFYTSPEFSSSSWEVLSIYQAVQNQLPTLAQWLSAVTPLRPGTASTTAVETFLDSLAGSMNNTTFVSTVIQNSWGRPPTASELTQFVNQLNSGGSTARVTFLNNTVFISSAFQQITNPLWITALYYTILVRNPDPAGFQFWVNSDTNPPGQPGIYYVMPASNLPAVYGIKLATIGQAVPPNLNLLGFLGSPEFQSLIQGATTPVNVGSFYNRTGIYVDGSSFTNGNSLDNNGFAYSGNLLSSPQTWDSTYNGASFSLGPSNSNDVISAAGQVIPLPAGQFSAMRMLATGVNGNQVSQTFKVTYSDATTQTFTQNLSDWTAPQNWTGETAAITMSYRDAGTGGMSTHTVYIYGYSFALNNTKTVTSLTLPTSTNVIVLGVTLAP